MTGQVQDSVVFDPVLQIQGAVMVRGSRRAFSSSEGIFISSSVLLEESGIGWQKAKRKEKKKGNSGKKGSDLGCFSFNSLQHGEISRLAEATIHAGLFVVFKTLGETLRAVVEGVAKRLMNALDGGALSHENLEMDVSPGIVE